ncbi:NUDIX hydrolase [Terribacillus saccharophilus]|uniref:NUDIX hydrolase n=1 Tax=Terribacillus saccharophilus TaxID=361277 RepID=UPI002DC75E9B|nr:NUDIX hydrolase [Terribacillus saccharophilus]
MTQDLTIDLGEQMLNCRTAGIIVKDNHVLMHKNKKDPFWTLIGGRIQLGEDSAHAVEREFEEELGILANAERLLWSVENFFTYKGCPYHEYSFIYLMQDVENRLRGTGEVISLESGEFHYEWVPLEKIEELPIKPDFLRGKLVNLPSASMHLIHKETTK